jgi:hypothetical protein
MFCKYCGNQFPDGEVCNCAEATAARAAAAAPVATAEAAPAAAAPAAGKVIGDAFKGMPKVLKNLLGNTSGAGVDLPSTIILAVGGLLLNILAWVCMVGGILGGLEDATGAMMWSYIEPVFDGMYGFGILGGLWTCIIPIALSMAIVVVGQLIRKEKVNVISAFTAGTCANVVSSVIFFVGALITLLIPVVGILLILVGIIAALAANYKLVGKLGINTDSVVGGLIAAAIAAVIFGLMAWIVSGVFTGYVEGPLAENLATMLGGSIEDIAELLLGLLGGF